MSVKTGKEYKPCSYKIVLGGEFTAFSIPQAHKNRQTGEYEQDGFINVLARGLHEWNKGDVIKIKKITGADLKQEKYFSVYADVEVITVAEKKAEPNKEILDDNIPDDLF